MGRERVEIWIIRHLFQGFLLKRELEKYDRSQREKQFKNGFSAFVFFFKMEEIKACLPAIEMILQRKKIGPNSLNHLI